MSPRADGIAIVGGGPAAKAAAGAYRAAGGEGPVRILAAEPWLPYQRPPLTKGFLRGQSSRAELTLEAAGWYAERGIEIVLDTTVAEIDLDAGLARGVDGRRWRFERCLLATGARSAVPDLPGVHAPGVQQIRTVGDSERLAAAGDGAVLVVGSGFIGCEAAVSLSLGGTEVTMATLEPSPQAQRLGEEVSERLAGWLREAGVELLPGAELTELAGVVAGQTTAYFEDGRESSADAVVLALGIARNDALAAATGIGVDDGVPVDDSMVSAHPRLLAAGDVAHAENSAAGRSLRVEHWGEALNQGEVAGRTLAGEEAAWDGAPGFWSTLGERTLKYAGWGDGWDEVRFEDRGDGGFSARYGRGGELVGVLAHGDDEAYEAGRRQIEERAPWR